MTLLRSVNLHFHMDDDEAGARVAREKLQRFPPGQRLGALTGTAPEVIDRIGEYMEVGADGLNIAFRPPIDWDAFEAYIDKVLPVFHQSASMPGVLQHAAPQLNHEFPGAPATPRLPQARQHRLFEPTQEGIGPGIAGFITPPNGVNIESGQSVDAVSNFSA